jgi:hypothetical protein
MDFLIVKSNSIMFTENLINQLCYNKYKEIQVMSKLIFLICIKNNLKGDN